MFPTQDYTNQNLNEQFNLPQTQGEQIINPSLQNMIASYRVVSIPEQIKQLEDAIDSGNEKVFYMLLNCTPISFAHITHAYWNLCWKFSWNKVPYNSIVSAHGLHRLMYMSIYRRDIETYKWLLQYSNTIIVNEFLKVGMDPALRKVTEDYFGDLLYDAVFDKNSDMYKCQQAVKFVNMELGLTNEIYECLKELKLVDEEFY